MQHAPVYLRQEHIYVTKSTAKYNPPKSRNQNATLHAFPPPLLAAAGAMHPPGVGPPLLPATAAARRLGAAQLVPAPRHSLSRRRRYARVPPPQRTLRRLALESSQRSSRGRPCEGHPRVRGRAVKSTHALSKAARLKFVMSMSSIPPHVH